MISEDTKQLSIDAEHKRIYPREYIEGIEHFNARRYFEAHEVWEEIWLRSAGDTKLFYQMLIQAAVGLHHYERGNARGGRGMHKRVIEKLQLLPSFYMSLDLTAFFEDFSNFFADLIERNVETAPQADKPRPCICLLSK
jgi:predicted metal-dependent hydrolase